MSAQKNMGSARRVQPDMIMAPNAFGSEVLEMALIKERIDGELPMEPYLDLKPLRGSQGAPTMVNSAEHHS